MIKKLCMLLFSLLCILSTGCGSKNEEMWIAGENTENIEENFDDDSSLVVQTNNIFVYVSGEVLNPGVYEFEKTARVFEAIDAAGGFSNEADTTCINLASTMEDGEQIIVYSVSSNEEAKPQDGIININSATAALLQTIPGIGESRALAIVAYRDKNGPFKNKEDIMQVSGIKSGLYEKIKDKIKVK